MNTSWCSVGDSDLVRQTDSIAYILFEVVQIASCIAAIYFANTVRYLQKKVYVHPNLKVLFSFIGT